MRFTRVKILPVLLRVWVYDSVTVQQMNSFSCECWMEKKKIMRQKKEVIKK